MSRIDVLPIQIAVLEHIENGNSWTGICKRLGWMETNTKPESSRLQRCLGVRKVATGGNSHNKKYEYQNKTIGYHTAVKIVRAIGREPMEFGL